MTLVLICYQQCFVLRYIFSFVLFLFQFLKIILIIDHRVINHLVRHLENVNDTDFFVEASSFLLKKNHCFVLFFGIVSYFVFFSFLSEASSILNNKSYDRLLNRYPFKFFTEKI